MNKKGVKMQEKNVQGKNRSKENRIQGKRVQEGKKQGSPKRENKRPESRAVKGVKPEQKQRSEQKQRTEQKQKAAKFGKPVLKQQSALCPGKFCKQLQSLICIQNIRSSSPPESLHLKIVLFQKCQILFIHSNPPIFCHGSRLSP